MKKISVKNVKEVLTREEMKVVTGGGHAGTSICRIGSTCIEQDSGRAAVCNGSEIGTNCHCGKSALGDNSDCHITY